MHLADVKTRPSWLAYHWLWQSLDWLFPPACGGCENLGVRWCNECQSKTQILTGPICTMCGKGLTQPGLCDCQAQPPLTRAVRSWAIYHDPLRQAIHSFKYKRNIGLTESFSIVLSKMLVELNWKLDLVTAVPLSKTRMRERGYNQSALLAWPLAKTQHLPFASQALVRTRETGTQIGRSAHERQINVAGAFRSEPQIVQGKKVLVIDDVYTTGATMQSCAQALLQAGATEVYGLTLARTARPADIDFV